MKPRTIALACGLGVVAIALQIGLVIGLTNMMTPRPEAPPNQRGAGPAAFVDVRAAPRAIDMGEVGVEPFAFDGVGMADMGWREDVGARPVEAAELKDLRGAVVAAEHRIAGPIKHDNLAVFFVHGPAGMKDQPILTLQEGLERGLVTVHEGGISITNRSTMPLFVQSGDIIKGGTQDRVLPNDYLIPAGATRFSVAAFCVESGRSFPREGELSTSFQVSCERVPTRDLRLAAYRRSQADIWSSVSRLQDQLARALGESVKSARSATSLQLTLEHPRVAEAAQRYVSELIRLPEGKDVVGCVIAVDGRVISADVYATPSLFEKFYPKLLRAAAVEALVSPRTGAAMPSADAVGAFLTTESARATRTDLAGGAHLIRHETSLAAIYDSCLGDGVVLHRSVLAK